MCSHRGRGTQLTLRNASVFILLFSVTLTIINAAQDHDVPVSVDGLRCDSCGSECTVMCGSKNFRACCFNYIKKRSIPWQSVTTGEGDNTDENNQEGKLSRSIVTDFKGASVSTSNPLKAPLILKQQGSVSGKHTYGGYMPEIITTGGESVEEGEVLFPIRLRDLMATMIRSLNSFENKRFGRMNVLF